MLCIYLFTLVCYSVEAGSSENQMRSFRGKYFEHETKQYTMSMQDNFRDLWPLGCGGNEDFSVTEKEGTLARLYLFFRIWGWNSKQPQRLKYFPNIRNGKRPAQQATEFITNKAVYRIICTILACSSSFSLGDLRQVMLSYLSFLICNCKIFHTEL